MLRGVASASIRIDQAANPIPNGVAGYSRDDIILSSLVTLRNGNANGVRTRRWVLEAPLESAAILSSTDGEAPTFTPDVYGTYLVKLSVNGGLDMGADGDEVDERAVIVRDPAGHRFPATKEAAQANYQIAPGVFNKEGWSPDLRRMLRSYDNRGGAAIEVSVAAGMTEDVEVTLPDDMDEGILQYMQVSAAASGDTTIRLLAGTNVVLNWQNFDPSVAAGARWYTLTSIMDYNLGLTDHKFTLQVTNNDAAPADYRIWLRVKAS